MNVTFYQAKDLGRWKRTIDAGNYGGTIEKEEAFHK